MANDISNPTTPTLQFEKFSDYLYAKITGQKNTLKNSKKLWTKIAEECNKENFKKVMIEEDVDTSLTQLEVYQLIPTLLKVGFLGITVAFIDRQKEHGKINQFGETVGKNRGLHGRIFKNREDAEKWLSKY